MTWKDCIPSSVKDNDTFMYFEEQASWTALWAVAPSDRRRS